MGCPVDEFSSAGRMWIRKGLDNVDGVDGLGLGNNGQGTAETFIPRTGGQFESIVLIYRGFR